MDSLPQQQTACDQGPGGGARGPLERLAANDGRMSQLVQAIEQEIIPRLLVAHRARGVQPAAPERDGPAITQEDVHHFTKLVLSEHEAWATEQITLFQQRGVGVERLFLDLLGPTARYLGELWNEDLCTFADVTVGLCRLQRVLRDLSGDLEPMPAEGGREHRVLLLPSPGEQHTFGLLMVAEFFRRDGWEVCGGSWAQGGDAMVLVAGDWFDVLGFSLGSESHLQALADTIREARRTALNRNLTILVGGPLFGAHPEYAERVGADGMTIDGREAPALAQRLMIVRAATLKETPGRSRLS